MNDEVIRERREMGISHADFVRIFPRLVADASVSGLGTQTRVEWPDGRTLRVELSEELVRRIALIRIPYVHISFGFHGFTEAACDAFMTRFDRAFQKGGG